MPTFTAIALDRLLEPGSGNPPPPKQPPFPIKVGRSVQEATTKRSIPQPNICPALYATPESTPLPDSPTLFPPYSPYIVNHKRRGPSLRKSHLESKAGGTGPNSPCLNNKFESVNGNGNTIEEKKDEDGQGSQGASRMDEFDGRVKAKKWDKGIISNDELVKPHLAYLERDPGTDDLFELQDSRSNASNSDVDENSSRWKPSTPFSEFYDAPEEISIYGTARSTYRIYEDELYEIRLNLLMEMEKRKLAEEALVDMRNQWEQLSHRLSLVGLTLPIPPTLADGVDIVSNLDPAEDLSQQIGVARFVADAVGRGYARAQVELEMESQIASKNFEIARLLDRLHYYEAANREMSQINQEAVELARQQRNRRRRRQRWIWGSLSLAICIGGAAIGWCYLPPSKPTPSDCASASSQE